MKGIIKGIIKFFKGIIKFKRYEDRKLYCVYIDVDGLKLINDGWSHKKGDQALKKIAKVLKAVLRKVDIVFRLGGDEFLVLMVGANELGLVRFFEAVSEKLKQISIGPSLSVTMGVAFWKKGLSLNALIHKADIDLLRQKKQKYKKGLNG
jgi:diguanylate cyclase (GGDEF)-like protein